MSRFGIRRRLKKVLGVSTSEPVRTAPKKAVPPAHQSPELQSSTPVPTSSPLNTPKAESKGESTQSTQSSTQPQSTELSEKDAKIAKHRRRTKKALLKLTREQGGTASLGDLHELGERRYFIAHKAFSDLMEEMVAEGLFLYDWSSQEATITETGTQFLEAP